MSAWRDVGPRRRGADARDRARSGAGGTGRLGLADLPAGEARGRLADGRHRPRGHRVPLGLVRARAVTVPATRRSAAAPSASNDPRITRGHSHGVVTTRGHDSERVGAELAGARDEQAPAAGLAGQTRSAAAVAARLGDPQVGVGGIGDRRGRRPLVPAAAAADGVVLGRAAADATRSAVLPRTRAAVGASVATTRLAAVVSSVVPARQSGDAGCARPSRPSRPRRCRGRCDDDGVAPGAGARDGDGVAPRLEDSGVGDDQVVGRRGGVATRTSSARHTVAEATPRPMTTSPATPDGGRDHSLGARRILSGHRRPG